MNLAFCRRGVTICAIVALASLGHVQPAAADTSVQQCSSHMQAPWVALYEDVDFQGASICILGTGAVNLYAISWGDRVSSVNIAAEGHFSEGLFACPEGCLDFHYGTRISDLRTIGWNDRVAFVSIDR